MKPFLVFVLLLPFAACSHPSAKPVAMKHYPLEGKIVSIDAKQQSAAVDAKAIPGFMEAMTMDYPIQSKDDLAKLHPGDNIKATVDVSDDGNYTLTNIQSVPATAPPK